MNKIQEIVLSISIVFLVFFLTKILISNPNILFLGLIFAIIVLFISFFSPPTGLSFLIFSMLLSPEIKLADVPGREVVVRVDDLLIGAVFLGWFSKSIFTKKLEIIITKPLMPIFFYIIICIFSTYLGILSGTVIFTKAFFYILKYIEYFIIYFLVTQIADNKKLIKTYLILFIITSFIVNIHGYTLIGKVERLYAPFDVPSAVIGGSAPGGAEANTYGGYLVIILSLLISLFCYANSITTELLYTFLIIFSLVPFAYTKSRSSYLAFVPMILTIAVLTEKKRNILIGGVLLLFILSPIIFPEATQSVADRIKETFRSPVYSDQEATILGFKIRELSALARIESWKRVFTKFLPSNPIIGHGVTGVGLVDTQIPRIIGEVGLLGLTIFLWLVFTIFKESIMIFNSTRELIYKSLSLSIISSIVGLLFHSIAANTFIIIRIMEPFWFLFGLLVSSKSTEDNISYGV